MPSQRKTAPVPHAIRAALVVMVLSIAAVSAGAALPAQAAATMRSWVTVANSNTLAPGSTNHFNSFNQPSVNDAGLVAFRARTQGPSTPIRGVYTRDTTSAGSLVAPVAAVGSTVPDPNNLASTFNEFPAFPRISASGSTVATRGQSSPVWEYTLPDTTTTKVGTSGVYATVNGTLTTAVNLLGAVPGQGLYSVPGAPAGTRFDQFPGSPAVDGTTVSFKGNYTDGTVGKTGIYFRDASQPADPIHFVASSDTPIPNQPAGGTVNFGSTAPPSAAGGRLVFVGLDNEDAPTMGGIYLADTTPSPTLTTLVGIGDQVPGASAADKFTGFGEALSFDGRYVAFSGSWGTATTSVTLTCPTDGNADLLAYCNQTYPDGYTTTVPVHQGIFVYDTTTSQLNAVTTTGATFSGFTYWVYSGAPPGVGGGDAGSVEPPRWRASSFVAVSALNAGYQVAFKGTPVAGGSGIYLGQGPASVNNIVTVLDTSTEGTSLDPQAPAGSVVTAVGLERDGFRGRNLALSVSMLNSTTSESWAGVYLTSVQALTLAATSLTPDNGPDTGGQQVTISGSGFVAGGTTVTLGSTTIPAAAVTVNSASSLTFTTPAGTAGPAAVSVSTPDGTSTPPLTYTYVATAVAPPTITSLSNGTVTTDASPLISGTGIAGYQVTLEDGSTTICTATVDTLGNWSCNLGTPLSAGQHTISATQRATSGPSSPSSSSITFTVTSASGGTGTSTSTSTSTGTGTGRLAATGSEPAPIGLAALLALVGGVALLLGNRNRSWGRRADRVR